TDDIAADFFNGLWEQLRPGLATAQGTPPTLFITYECVGSCGRLGSTKISVLDAYVKPTSRSFVAAGTGVKIELGEIKVVDLSKKIARCADDPAKIRLHHWFSFRIPFKITLTITGGSELSYSTFFLREAVACTYCCELEGGHYSGGQDG
ncbi:MAG TPA: hypothetical protein VNH64_01205, partial [Parvularculaceae bacterium]|nr:hypothetical protein [Parvularculaceae bacterium]